MRTYYKHRIPAAIAAGVAVLAAIFMTACGNIHGPDALSATGSPTVSGSPSPILSNAPTCGPATGPISSTVSITMSTTNDSFSQSCYYAPANQPFTISFTNPIFTLNGNQPVRITLIISPSGDPAIVPDPAYPESAYGDMTKASFVSSPVTAPDTGVFSVPSLPAGSYVIQTNLRPLIVIATLVLQ